MTFDTEKFIREIENRKAIWDISSEEYSDRDVKKRKWEEITNIMCEENLTANEKSEFGKSLQQKWKNIRTSYSREIKRRAGAKSGAAASPKSPYVYFEQLQFLKATVINNETQNSMGETRPAETNDDSDCIQGKRPVSKKKKTCDDENLVQVLKESIAIREERERKQESDSDRLFMLSLLEDFKNIQKHRKLSTRMELIDIIKRAQMPFMETYNSEFGVFRQGHVDYEPGTSTARLFRPETSVSGQYRHGYSTEYGPGNSSSRQYRHEYSTEYRPEISSSEQNRHGYSTQSNYGPEASSSESRRAYSTSVPDKQDNTGYTEVLSPSDTNVTDTSQNSELLELFQENSLP